MSRELDVLAREFAKTPATVIRRDLSLYQTTMSSASSSFLREVESQCKRQKLANVVLIAVIPEPEKTTQSK
jgi:hypothetical protein